MRGSTRSPVSRVDYRSDAEHLSPKSGVAIETGGGRIESATVPVVVACYDSRMFPTPRAAYIHVPFCRHRCGYCDFPLITGRDELIDDYLRAISLELASLGTPREVDTLFFGGGTPTHLPPDRLRRLLAVAREWLPLAEG